MKNKLFFTFIALAIFSLNSFSAEIKVAGGAAPMNNIFKRLKTSFEKKSGHSLALTEQSPELALGALEKGEIDVASAGLPWEDWIKLCKDKNINIDETKPFHYSSIGKDTIQIYVNKSSKISNLTFAQLEKIFTGSAQSWKEFGGEDKPIKVVFSPNIGGTNKFFSKVAMAGHPYTTNVTKAENAEAIAEAIGKDAEAIGFGPVGIDMNKYGIKAVDTPEIFRPILFVFLSADKKILDLKNFLSSSEGQALIKR